MCGGGGKEKDKEGSRSKVSILHENKPERADVVLFWESPTFHCLQCVLESRKEQE